MNNISSKKVKTRKLKNGNAALFLNKSILFLRSWFSLFFFILFFVSWVAEYFIYSTNFVLFLFFILLLFFIVRESHSNEKIIELWLNKNIDIRIHNVLRNTGNNVHEIKRKVFYQTIGTYGKIQKIFMLVLLSNGEVLEYELLHHPSKEGEESFYELIRKPKICTDSCRKKAIKGWSFIGWWKNNVYTDKTRPIFWIVAFFIISAGLVWLGIKLWNFYEEKIVYAFIFYVFVFIICFFSIGKTKNKFLKAISFIVFSPLIIINSWFTITLPIVTILSSLFFSLLFVFGTPVLLLSGFDYVFNWELESTTIVFLTLAIGSITFVHLSKFVRWFIRNFTPLKDWKNHNYEAYKEDLSTYILEPSNINGVIYLLYFIFFAVSSYDHFQNNNFQFCQDYEEAILKAFLVFIAFSNAVKYLKAVDFDFKTFITKVFRLLSSYYKD